MKNITSTILLIGYPNGSNRRIKSEVEKTGDNVKCYIVPPDDFQIYISNITKRDEIYLRGERVYANSISGIIPRIGRNLSYGCTVVKHLNENLGIPSTSTADGLLLASNKLTSGQAMSKSGIVLPKTMYLQNADNINFIIDKLGGLGDGNKLVAKLVTGSQGSAVMILESLLAASTALGTFLQIKKSVLLQQFIKTAGNDERSWDIRAFVVNGKVVSAIKRFALDGDFRSNVSISKEAEKITLTDKQKEIAVNAANSIGLSGVNGIDLAISKEDQKIYVIEANGNPSLKGITKFGKVNVARKIAEYAMSISNKKSRSVDLSAKFKPQSLDKVIVRKFNSIRSSFSNASIVDKDRMYNIRHLLSKDEILGISEDEFLNSDEYDGNEYSISNNKYVPIIDKNEIEKVDHSEYGYYNNPINQVIYKPKTPLSNLVQSNPLNKKIQKAYESLQRNGVNPDIKKEREQRAAHERAMRNGVR